MNTNDAIDHRNMLRVDAHPVSLRLPPGAAVFTVRGEVWLTQEGMAADIVLKRGERFDVRNRSKLVISATSESADVFIVDPSVARAHRQDNVYDFARSRAAQLRHDELVRLANAIALRLRSLAARWRGARVLTRISAS